MDTTDSTRKKEKNLVVFCDGTNNMFCENNTNVVRLLSLALKDNDRQILFYEPGLGTFPAPGAMTALSKWFTRTMGSAFGYGLSSNICVSYDFLVEHYRPGDRIYLFGFSRGAYTVRALAALIHVCGLLRTKNHNLVPYIIKLFISEAAQAKKKNDKIERRTGRKQALELPVCSEFKRVMAISPEIHFMGLWDTVSSVGTIYNPFKLPHTHWNPSVRTVRHAISIDEKRKFFRTNLWSSSPQRTDVKQVWFPGVHADIGGGYPEAESGLAKITLAWMLDEARAARLDIDDTQLPSVFPEADSPAPLAAPDPCAKMHNELKKFGWKLLQWIPRRYWYRNEKTGQFDRKWDFSPGAKPRFIPAGSLLDASVAERMACVPDYRPENVPSARSDTP